MCFPAGTREDAKNAWIDPTSVAAGATSRARRCPHRFARDNDASAEPELDGESQHDQAQRPNGAIKGRQDHNDACPDSEQDSGGALGCIALRPTAPERALHTGCHNIRRARSRGGSVGRQNSCRRNTGRSREGQRQDSLTRCAQVRGTPAGGFTPGLHRNSQVLVAGDIYVVEPTLEDPTLEDLR